MVSVTHFVPAAPAAGAAAPKAARLAWWGDRGAPVVFALGGAPQAAAFPVHCAPPQLMHYLTDMRALPLDLLDDSNGSGRPVVAV